MSLFDKLRDLVSAEDIDDDYDDDFSEPEPRPYVAPVRKPYGLPAGTEPLPRREPLREPLARERERERERENVIPLRSNSNDAVQRITTKFKIVLIEPKAFDDCPKLVDSLRSRKPVIINLETIENDTARKIFDFLSGATYALNGNVQKIAQNIFVFLPENVDVQAGPEPSGFKYSEEKTADRWR